MNEKQNNLIKTGVEIINRFESSDKHIADRTLHNSSGRHTLGKKDSAF